MNETLGNQAEEPQPRKETSPEVRAWLNERSGEIRAYTRELNRVANQLDEFQVTEQELGIPQGFDNPEQLAQEEASKLAEEQEHDYPDDGTPSPVDNTILEPKIHE